MGTRLDSTARTIGGTLGRAAATLDKMRGRQRVRTDGKPRADAAPKAKPGKAGKKASAAVSTAEAGARPEPAAKRERKTVAPREHTKPGDTRATIRATDGRKFTARQRGRG